MEENKYVGSSQGIGSGYQSLLFASTASPHGSSSVIGILLLVFQPCMATDGNADEIIDPLESVKLARNGRALPRIIWAPVTRVRKCLLPE